MSRFEGVYAALTTPFVDDEVSVERLRANLQKYNGTGLDGYVVLGSTGEAAFLSDVESERLVAAAKESAAPQKQVIAGTSRESAKSTVDFTNRMAGYGIDAALVKPPHYYKSRMTAEALRLFFLTVADQSKVPVIIYNFPQNTGITLDTALIVELAQHPNISGIKDSSGSLSNLTETIPRAGQRFDFLLGTGSIVLPGLQMGASGAILALAAAIPELCVKLYTLFREGKMEEARRLQIELAPLNKALTQTLGIPAIKHAMDLLGYFGGPPRLPLLPLDQQEKEEIFSLLRGMKLPVSNP